MKKINFLILISILFSCESVKKVQEVNLYSQRHYAVDELQYENFTKLTGIKVNVTKANADELIQRLKNEGEKTEADLFITVDVGKLWQAGDMGLLQKINSDIINPNINQSLLDRNNYWVPVTYLSLIHI